MYVYDIFFTGIGQATVERLALEGATVAIFDINNGAGKTLTQDLVAKGLNVSFYKVDVSEKNECSKTVQQFVETSSLPGVHYLVNCAAYFGHKGVFEAEKKDWEKTLGVNVVGYSNMVQACHPYMSKLPGDKSIVNLSSGSGYRAQADHMTYSSSKAAILTMTKCMALDLSKDCIRVNSVSPAFVWTPALLNTSPHVKTRQSLEDILGQCLIIKRLTKTSEQASSICFLLSEDASCITASDLPVDGGYLALGPEGLGENSVFAGSEY